MAGADGVGGSSGGGSAGGAGSSQGDKGSSSAGKSDRSSGSDRSSSKSDKGKSSSSSRSDKDTFGSALSDASKSSGSTSVSNSQSGATSSAGDSTNKPNADGAAKPAAQNSAVNASFNSHRGYGPDNSVAGGIDQDVNAGLAAQSHRAGISSNGALPTNSPGNNFGYENEFSGIGPNGAPMSPSRPVDKPATDVNPPNESYPFAGDLQTMTLGANIDAPLVGDLTVGVTIEFGKEFDIGLMAEHGTIVSPHAIDNDTGLAVTPDLSMGVNAYYNQGYIPFESGHVDSKEIMGQYALGPGMNFTHEDGITSLNVYGGAGAGASVTYDRAYHASLRDGVRWAVDQANDFGQWIRDSVR